MKIKIILALVASSMLSSCATKQMDLFDLKEQAILSRITTLNQTTTPNE